MKKLVFLQILLFVCNSMDGIITKDQLDKGTMKKENVFFVILAGGSGERLWPLSKQKNPKQLLVVGKQKTLLEQAIDRVSLLAYSKDNIVVSTTQKFAQQVHKCVAHLAGDILVEPGARDTGPAILYTCMRIQEKNPDAVLVFLPADPYIPQEDNNKFSSCVQNVIMFAQQHDGIALIGIEPTYAATGYGYIELDQDQNMHLHKVKRFHEKPTLDVATYYLKLKNMLWNSGMFCGKAQIFINEFKMHCPKVYQSVHDHIMNGSSFDAVEKVSVDYAIMEKCTRIWVQPATFSWCDVGNIGVLLSLKKKHNTLANNTIEIDAKNNLIDVPNKLVALIGVDDLCVVQTEDTLLITKRAEATKVRSVVNRLKQGDYTDYL